MLNFEKTEKRALISHYLSMMQGGMIPGVAEFTKHEMIALVNRLRKVIVSLPDEKAK